MCNFIFQDYTSFYSFYYFLINLFYFFSECGYYLYIAYDQIQSMRPLLLPCYYETHTDIQKCTKKCVHTHMHALIQQMGQTDNLHTHTHTHTNILSHAQNELLMKSTHAQTCTHNHTYIHIKDSCATPYLNMS